MPEATEKTKPQGTTEEEDPEDAPVRWWFSGANGIHYPGDYHPKSGRIRIRYEDLADGGDTHTVKKSLSEVPVGLFARQVLSRTAPLWLPLLKGADVVKLPPGTRLTPEEMKQMHLTWITAHPHGPGTDGIPLIVHDNGDHYVVVGGAGGKLNQMVLKKDAEGKKDKAKLKAEAQEKQAAAQKEAAEKDPSGFRKLEQAAKLYQAKSKEALQEHVGKALEKLGGDLEALKAEARKQATAKAAENPNVTPEELEKFARKAEKAAVQQAQKAVESAVQKALDAVAKAEIMQEAVQAQDVEAVVAGKQLTKTLSPQDLQDLLESAATLDHVKTAAAAVQKALKTGQTDQLKGIEAFYAAGQPSEAELKEWAAKGYLQREAVKRQVKLVQESRLASESAQRRDQALGAHDALNAYAAMVTGESLFTPDLVRYLGPENAARVTAAYLASKGHDPKALAQKLGKQLADRVDAHTLGALKLAGEMDALVDLAVSAAESGQGTVTVAQAYIVKERQAARKWSLLNLTRGHIQAASTLYYQLQHPGQAEMVLPGGDTQVATLARAKSLGLQDGDYTVEEFSPDRFQLRVRPEALAKLVTPMTPASAERGARLAELQREAEQGGAGSWQPSQGWQDGTHGTRVDLAPHQIAAARAIVEEGKVLLSHSAGSGKTAVIYAAGAELLASGKCKRGIITMPAKPRSQQEDYTEEGPAPAMSVQPGSVEASIIQSAIHKGRLQAGQREELLQTAAALEKTTQFQGLAALMTALDYVRHGGPDGYAKGLAQEAEASGKPHDPQFLADMHTQAMAVKAALANKVQRPGEKSKFLTPEMADRFSVVSSTADLQEKLQAVKAGKLSALIMSPEMLREHADTLKQAGFGGKDSFLFADEAHELAIGEQDQHGDVAGSGKARAAKALAQGCGHVALMTGTAIENDASELHSLLNVLDPETFKEEDRKAFGERWERVASAGKESVLGGELLGHLHGDVGGYMLHYSQPPTHAGKPVQLEDRHEVLPLAPEQQSAIVKANEQRAADEKSPDPNVRAAAALKWSGAVQRACIGPAMFDRISSYVGERRGKDPSYKAVVWSQELLPIEELKSRLGQHGKVVTITGGNNDKETKAAIEAFQKDPEVCAVVVSNAANFGVNLQAGHSVLKCGFPPVPSKDGQLDARIWRRGQDKDVESVTFLGEHPLMQEAYQRVHGQKGRALNLLADLADDHLLGQVLAQYDMGQKVAKSLLAQLEELVAGRVDTRSEPVILFG